MKAAHCFLLLATVWRVVIWAEPAEESAPPAAPPPAAFEITVEPEVEVAPEPLPEIPEPPPVVRRQVVYGGFLAELARAERPATTFSLRQPVPQVPEEANLITDPKTERIRGFVLFAIRW